MHHGCVIWAYGHYTTQNHQNARLPARLISRLISMCLVPYAQGILFFVLILVAKWQNATHIIRTATKRKAPSFRHTRRRTMLVSLSLFFSVCIPAYNRALSVFASSFAVFSCVCPCMPILRPSCSCRVHAFTRTAQKEPPAAPPLWRRGRTGSHGF
jgi:hypothetical protein